MAAAVLTSWQQFHPEAYPELIRSVKQAVHTIVAAILVRRRVDPALRGIATQAWVGGFVRSAAAALSG